MNKSGLVSIIIPIYNVEKYLNKCIQSIVTQTYENLEIILVDDGSTDKSSEICEEWKEKDNRIKVIHKKNGGLSDARNVGMKMASGEYVAFIDSDDYVDFRMFEELVKTIVKENADLVICNLEKVTEEGEIIFEELPIENEVFSGIEALEKLNDPNGWIYAIACNKLYKKYVLKDIVFPIGKINEDQFVAHRVYFNCEKIVSLTSKYYKYVQRNGSIMNGICDIRCLDEIEAYCERFEFYQSHGLVDLYEKFAIILKIVYLNQRTRIRKPSSYKEWMRVRQIDKLFKKTYFKCVSKASMREKIKFSVPTLWFFYKKIKKR